MQNEDRTTIVVIDSSPEYIPPSPPPPSSRPAAQHLLGQTQYTDIQARCLGQKAAASVVAIIVLA